MERPMTEMREFVTELNKTPEGRAMLGVMLRDADEIIALKARRSRLEEAAKRALMERDRDRVDRYMNAADAITEILSERYLGGADYDERWDEDEAVRLAENSGIADYS